MMCNTQQQQIMKSRRALYYCKFNLYKVSMSKVGVKRFSRPKARGSLVLNVGFGNGKWKFIFSVASFEPHIIVPCILHQCSFYAKKCVFLI
jgi:hypothetical protein